MNWLFVILLLVIVLSAVTGYYRGAVRTVFSMALLVLVLVLAGFSPYIGNVLRQNTQITGAIRTACTEIVQASLTPAQETAVPTLPEEVMDRVQENAQCQTGDVVSNEAEYLTNLAVDGLAFAGSFLLVWIVLKVLMRFAGVFTKVPVLKFTNRVCGAVLGGARAFVWIWMFFLLLTIFGGTLLGSIFMESVHASRFLQFLYDNNLLLKLVLFLIR